MSIDVQYAIKTCKLAMQHYTNVRKSVARLTE